MPTELLTRSASIEPTTFDEANRTVRVTWSTGAAVDRRDAQGPFREVLSLDPAHVQLDQLRGASVLDTHQQIGLRNVIGVVVDAGIDNGQGWALVRLSARPEVAPIVQDIKDGVIRHVSVGYSVKTWRDSTDPTTGARTRTAVAWTPRTFLRPPAG